MDQFVKIHKSFFDTRAWLRVRKFSAIEAFIDLYQMASYPTVKRDQTMLMSRGQLLIDCTELLEKWQWSSSSFYLFFDKLVNEGFITKSSHGGFMLVTILHYERPFDAVLPQVTAVVDYKRELIDMGIPYWNDQLNIGLPVTYATQNLVTAWMMCRRGHTAEHVCSSFKGYNDHKGHWADMRVNKMWSMTRFLELDGGINVDRFGIVESPITVQEPAKPKTICPICQNTGLQYITEKRNGKTHRKAVVCKCQRELCL